MRSQISILGPHEGSLLVTTDIADFASTFALECGSRLSTFAPSDLDPATLLAGTNLLINADLAADPREWQVVSTTDGVKVGRNFSEAWTLAGGNTGYLTIGPDVASAQLRYVDPILGNDIPVAPGQTFTAHGRFGAHRASGRLRLVVLDAGGGVVAEESGAISNVVRGGTSLDQYQAVELQLIVPETAVSARLEIEFMGHVHEPSSTSKNAFIFFTRLGLVAGVGTSRAAPGPRPDTVPSLIRLLSLSDAGSLYQAPVDVDAAMTAKELTVRPLNERLHVPTATFALPDVSGVSAVVDPLRANALSVSVTGYDGSLRLYIDGELVGLAGRSGDAGLGRQETFVVAEGHCDGALHFVEVRDDSDLRVLARAVEIFPYTVTPWVALQQNAGYPLPSHLAPAAGYRYRALVEQIRELDGARRSGVLSDEHVDRLAGLAHLHKVLESGFENLVTFPRLDFPSVEAPEVSVVVPVHNKFNVTYFCLCALLFASNQVSFEVVVVDDGSDDETSELATIAPNVTVVHHETAQGFVRACNAGARKARGDYIVLLNNDTEPTTGWLDELVGTFNNFDRVGMAGSKLLYPDGRLQEAGGIVWRTGNPWNYGRGRNPQDPRYSYARQADYLSGAALMISRTVWDEVGGLSDEFAPAYFEDTDLGFKVRAAGYATWFAPLSVVYHFEGMSNGTDVTTTTGLKRFQEINRPKFKRKWAAAVQHNGEEGQDPDLVKDRGILGRVLFIDYQVPRPDQDAGSYAAFQEMRLVQSLGYKVTFMATNLAYMGKYSDALNRMGIETIYAPFVLSVDEFLEQRGREFDAFYLTRYYVAQDTLGSIRKRCPGAKVIFNNADLHFLREMRVATRSADPSAWKRAITTREDELAIMCQVDLVLSYNDVEHSVIMSHNLAQSRVATAPWVVRTLEPEEIAGFEARAGIAFLGNFRHPPNAEAVEFFVNDVVPRLRERLPGARFDIYGSAMPVAIRALADDFINPVGYIESLAEVYDTHRVFVAPLLTGAGIKGKVLGAMSHGLPSVLSLVAAEGTAVRDGYDCKVAGDPDEWVEAVAVLYEDQKAWERMSRHAAEFTRTTYSFERGRTLMRKAFEQVGIYHTAP